MNQPNLTAAPRHPDPHSSVQEAALGALARHSFCTLATSSKRNRPHVVGVVYAVEHGLLYIHTLEASRKVRNVRENPNVAICVPVRRFPMAPPFCVQFQATARVLATDDPEITALTKAGRLKKIRGHGAMEVPGSCVLRVEPGPTISTYGIGVPLLTIVRDRFHASRSVRIG